MKSVHLEVERRSIMLLDKDVFPALSTSSAKSSNLEIPRVLLSPPRMRILHQPFFVPRNVSLELLRQGYEIAFATMLHRTRNRRTVNGRKLEEM